jgi:hypothetical protein
MEAQKKSYMACKGRWKYIFFLKYASFKKNFNMIWELDRIDGLKVSSFNNLEVAGKHHFQALFKEPDSTNFVEILEVVRIFPRLFDEDINTYMEGEVTKVKQKYVLSSFNKPKILGLDSLTI